MAFRSALLALVTLAACSSDPDPSPSVVVTTGAGGAGHASAGASGAGGSGAGGSSGHGAAAGQGGHAGPGGAGAGLGGAKGGAAGASGASGQGGAGSTVGGAGPGGSAGAAGEGSAGADAGAAGSGSPVCGNGVVEDGEMCDEVSAKCVGCQSPCGKEGGHTCGGNGIPGNPDVLYVCQGGKQVAEQDCGAACVPQPPGVPDRCPLPPTACDPPASLVDAIDTKPYVEQSCQSTTWPGWPYEARTCSYTSGPLSATVITATPSPERLACWIIDSVDLIPALAGLRQTDPAAWEKGLAKIGVTTVILQSSRIFPLEGGVIEDQGNGYVNYPFYKGVTKTCSTGCFCRINSLHRTEWCSYVASTGGSYDACIAKVGTSGLTDGWGEQCLQNHIASWTSDSNAHFRAKAYAVNKTVAKTCPTAGSCSSADVLAALAGALKLEHLAEPSGGKVEGAGWARAPQPPASGG